MHDVNDVLVRPVVTEKSADLMDRRNAYTFVVAQRANKVEIAKAVEAQFGVHVKNVRTMRYAGKTRRVGRNLGRRAAWKKAVVTLGAGEAIEIFEGV